MEVSNYLVSWVVTYLGDLQPTYIGVIMNLLSTMDIPVGGTFFFREKSPTGKNTPKSFGRVDVFFFLVVP